MCCIELSIVSLKRNRNIPKIRLNKYVLDIEDSQKKKNKHQTEADNFQSECGIHIPSQNYVVKTKSCKH